MDEDAPAGQRPRGSLSSFVLLLFILFLFTSQSGDDFFTRHHYQDVLTTMSEEAGNYTAWLEGKGSNFSLVSGALNLIQPQPVLKMTKP